MASLVSKLLDKNPETRLKNAHQIKKHEFFRGVDFGNLSPPFKPHLQSETDTRYFSQTLKQVMPSISK